MNNGQLISKEDKTCRQLSYIPDGMRPKHRVGFIYFGGLIERVAVIATPQYMVYCSRDGLEFPLRVDVDNYKSKPDFESA